MADIFSSISDMKCRKVLICAWVYWGSAQYVKVPFCPKWIRALTDQGMKWVLSQGKGVWTWTRDRSMYTYTREVFEWLISSVKVLTYNLHIRKSVQGVVTCMPPVEAFATTIKFFDRQKVCLIAWYSLLRLLITWFSRVKGQIAAACSWSFDF